MGPAGWTERAEGILWVGDRVRLVGSNGAVRAEAHRLAIEPEDVDGMWILPGFVDAHTHFLHVGIKQTRPDLRGSKSLQEALGRLAGWLAAHPGSTPVIADGWDESEWTDRIRPTRQDVDGVVAASAKSGDGPLDRPVVLRRIDGHIAVAGSGALPLVMARWGGEDGAVDAKTGLLLEAPSLYLNEVMPSTSDELDWAVGAACAEAHRLGVTAVGDYSQAPYRNALQGAAARGRLTVRVFSSIYVQQLGAELEAGFRTGRPGGTSDWLRDGGLKVFLDGSLGAHTAHLREPYRDGHRESRGSRIWTDEELDHHIGSAHAAGVQVHAHAIGDAAIDQALEAFARLAARQDLEGKGWDCNTLLRHRIEHFEIVHPDQVVRMAEAGLVASSQPNFVGEWSAKGGLYEGRLGARYQLNNRFRSLKDAGIPICFGSDGMPFGPLVGLQSAVAHPDPGQRLDPLEAAWHYTWMAAWSLHWPEIGVLRTGAFADLVLLDVKEKGGPKEWIIQETISGGQSRYRMEL